MVQWTVQWMRDEVFMAYTTYSVLMVVNMMLMLLMTLSPRHEKVRKIHQKVTSGNEFGVELDLLGITLGLQALFGNKQVNEHVDHEEVWQVTRSHRNHMENVIPFVMIGFFYTLSGPELYTALLHFRIFAGCQIVHTIVSVFDLPQLIRGLTFLAGYGVTFSMAYRVLSTVLRL